MKWSAVAAMVLAALVWLASGYWGMYWSGGRGGNFSVSHGVVRAMYFKDDLLGSFFGEWPAEMPPKIRNSFFGATPLYTLEWAFAHRSDVYFGYREIRVPLWFPVVVLGGIAGVLWRWDVAGLRNERLGKCARCGYDRAGIGEEARCPECGTVPRLTSGNQSA